MISTGGGCRGGDELYEDRQVAICPRGPAAMPPMGARCW